MTKPNQRLLFVAASFIAAVLNYFLYPALARILSSSDFGDISALLALATQVGGVFIAFNIISIYLVKTHPDSSHQKLGLIQNQLLRTFLILTLIALLSYPWLKQFLHLASGLYIVPLVVILASSIPVALWTGYFQGKGELARVGAFNICSSLAKLLLSIAGAYYWGGLGALLGITIGQIVGIVAVLRLPGAKPPRLSLTKTVVRHSTDSSYLKSIKAYVSSTIVCVLLLAVLQAADLIAIKNLLSPHDAGLYAGLGSLARIIFFGGFILIWLTLAEFKLTAGRHNRRLTSLVAGAILLLSSLFVLVMHTADRLVVNIFLGNHYYDQTALTLASIFQSLVLLITFYVYSLLVRGNRQSALLITVCVAATAGIATTFAHNSAIIILEHLIIGTIAGMIVSGVLLLLVPRRSKHV